MSNYRPSFWLPDFVLPPETKTELEAFANELKIADAGRFIRQIEAACQVYLGSARNEAERLPQGEINKQLIKLSEHAAGMALILENVEVVSELKLKVEEIDIEWRISNPDFFDMLKEGMRIFSEIAANTPPPRRGRPEGGGVDRAGRAFAGALCETLAGHGIRPRIVNKDGCPAGEAHLLLSIVREPLHIGKGDLDGILSGVITATY